MLCIAASEIAICTMQTPSWQKPQRMIDGAGGSGGSSNFGDPAKIGVQLSDASLGKSRFLSSTPSSSLDLKVAAM